MTSDNSSKSAGVVFALAFGVVTAMTGCSGSNPASAPPQRPMATVSLPNGTVLTALTGPNVLPLSVDGSTCNSSNLYPNKPCVSVTICSPGFAPPSPSCQTINDVLLDTGSYGLRLFSSVVSVALTPVQVTSTGAPGGTTSLGECATFGTGSDWGSVAMANVALGGEPAVQVPIQLVNSTFSGGAPSACGTPDVTPAQAGFNGILGVGLFGPDCGQAICGTAASSWYYSCSGSTCSQVALGDSLQVTNPVAVQPVDNNGVIVQLPSIPQGGTPAINGGFVVLGIGTQSNNVPTGVTAYAADPNVGEFQTTYNGAALASFVDTGSNGYFFDDGAIVTCASPNDEWYCPAATIGLCATISGVSGSATAAVPFLVGNALQLFASANNVFVELAGTAGGQSFFDWGLPFFIGRNVYVGLQGAQATQLNASGPFWAF